MVPVTYEAVFTIVPGLHARPPVLPGNHSRGTLPPPLHGYDLIIHVGAGHHGPVSLERFAHKTGYELPDVSGKFAPIIEASSATKPVETSSAEQREKQRLKFDGGVVGMLRGF